MPKSYAVESAELRTTKLYKQDAARASEVLTALKVRKSHVI